MVGQILGCLAGGPISDTVGRRTSLLGFASLSVIGWLTMALAPSIPNPTSSTVLLFAGRFLNGFGDSLGVPPAILFVSEVSSGQLRGLFMNSATVAASLGIPCVYVVGSLISWRATAAVGLFFPSMAFAMFFFVVQHDSPVYHAAQDENHKAVKALRWYRRGHSEAHVRSEFKVIEDIASPNSTQDKPTSFMSFIKLYTRPETLSPFLIVSALFGLLPLTGIYSVTFYAMDLFKSLGFEDATVVVAVSAGTVRAIGSIISGLIVFRKGRRFVLLTSCIGVLVSVHLATVAILVRGMPPSEYLPAEIVKPVCSYVLLITIPVFMFFLGVGMAPVPWILLGEWFVPETKGMIGGVCTCIFFVSALLSLQITGLIEKTVGVQGMFISFGLVCILFTVITVRWVPETQGKSYKAAVLNKDSLLNLTEAKSDNNTTMA